MLQLDVREFVFVVTGEKSDRVLFKRTFTTYDDALEEYCIRSKNEPEDVLVSLQKVEKFFKPLDNPTKK